MRDRGRTLLTGDLDLALQEAGKAAEADSEHGAAQYWLGRVQIERGDMSAAEATLADLRAVAASIPSSPPRATRPARSRRIARC